MRLDLKILAAVQKDQIRASSYTDSSTRSAVLGGYCNPAQVTHEEL